MSAPTMSPRRSALAHVVGVLGVVAMGFTVWLGLWVTPPDPFQGNLARLLYIHPAIATVALYWVGRRGRRGQPALPVAAHALVLLGPPGRRRPSRWARCSPPSRSSPARCGVGRSGACGGPGTPA